MKTTKYLPGLPLERALRVISGRWKVVILSVLFEGPKRTCELETQIVGLSQKVLIEQLRALEEHGLVERRLFADAPQRVDYALTALGESLRPMLTQLYDWGLRQAETQGETSRLLPCEAVVRAPKEKSSH
jgi:DNA-binding HxlR family transcriptional regulator